jgi:hypothetical protein
VIRIMNFRLDKRVDVSNYLRNCQILKKVSIPFRLPVLWSGLIWLRSNVCGRLL